jgi:GTP-binding protein
VGKSSLINALTGRKALARTSHTPGRTRALVFFTGPAKLVLVDLPGYGYAAAAKSAIAAWTALVDGYLGGRANLGRIYLMVDARHGLKEADEGALATLDRAAVNYQLVLSKTDALAASALAARTREVAAQLTRHPAAFPDVLATSSSSGSGIPQLRAALARLLAERSGT